MLNILLVWSITNSDCSVVQPEDVLTPPMSGLNWQKIWLWLFIILFPMVLYNSVSYKKEDKICRNTLMDIIKGSANYRQQQIYTY